MLPEQAVAYAVVHTGIQYKNFDLTVNILLKLKDRVPCRGVECEPLSQGMGCGGSRAVSDTITAPAAEDCQQKY